MCKPSSNFYVRIRVGEAPDKHSNYTEELALSRREGKTKSTGQRSTRYRRTSCKQVDLDNFAAMRHLARDED